VTPEERRARIAELVRREGNASIDELAANFAVTEQTIRRDVNTLCDDGVLRRRHGGVALPPQVEAFSNDNIPYDSRRTLYLHEKRSIAHLVAQCVPDGASLFLSVGTTPELVARELVNHKNLRVFTHNLNVALALCDNPSIEITMPGGPVRNRYRDIGGPNLQDFFTNYTVDIGIFGVGGIDACGGLLDFSEEEVTARLAICANSRTTFFVADHSKFGRNAIVSGGHITEVDHFFTDQPPPDCVAQQLDAANVVLHLPKRQMAIDDDVSFPREVLS